MHPHLKFIFSGLFHRYAVLGLNKTVGSDFKEIVAATSDDQFIIAERARIILIRILVGNRIRRDSRPFGDRDHIALVREIWCFVDVSDAHGECIFRA